MRHALSAWRVIALIVALHLCLTLFLANALAISMDEAYTLSTTGSGVGHSVQQAVHFELQPPGFYVLLTIWRMVDSGLFFARLFSVLCVAATIPLVAIAWRRYEPQIHPGWIAAALALNAFAITAAVDARPYALSLLLAAALLLLFEVGFLSDAPGPRSRFAYAAVSILALYTQYYLGFILLGGGVALAVLGRRLALRDYLALMSFVLLASIPLLVAVPGQVSQHTVAVHPTPLGESVHHTLVQLDDLLLSTSRIPRAGRWLCRGTLAALMLVAAKEFLNSRTSIRGELVALSTILVVALVCVLGVQWSLGHMIAGKRHTAFMLPLGLLLLFRIVAASGRTRPIVLLTGLLLLSTSWQLAIKYKGLFKGGDHARVASYLSKSESAREPILVFPGEEALPLAHHYAGRNDLVGLPVGASLVRYDPRDFVWRNRDHVVRRLQRSSASGTCWLVTYQWNERFGLDLRSELLEAVVESDFEVLERHEFESGALVRRLRRRVASRGAPVETGLETVRGQF